ncbi:MAG: lysophospholipid acyltransferase family protein [Eubacterium sp.]
MIRFILNCIFVLIVIIISIPLLLVELILNIFNKKARHAFAQGYIRIALKGILFISGTTLTIDGFENIPKNTPVLYVGNHRSYFDIFIIYSLFSDNIAFVAKDQMKKFPYLNLWMYFIDALFLDRSNPREGLKTILKAIDYIKQGLSVFIYPEGTRSDTDTMLPFKEGSMKIAEKSGCPIIPVAMTGTASIFEEHIPRITKEHVYVSFGEPIYPDKMNKDEKKMLGAYARDKIQELLNKHKSSRTGNK